MLHDCDAADDDTAHDGDDDVMKNKLVITTTNTMVQKLVVSMMRPTMVMMVVMTMRQKQVMMTLGEDEAYDFDCDGDDDDDWLALITVWGIGDSNYNRYQCCHAEHHQYVCSTYSFSLGEVRTPGWTQHKPKGIQPMAYGFGLGG